MDAQKKTRKATTVRKLRTYLAILTAISMTAAASGCGDGKEVLTSEDVREAFSQYGMSLEAYEVGPGIPALGSPADAAGPAGRVVCLIFGDSVTARGFVKTANDKASNVSRAIQVQNVAVLLDPEATPEDVRRTLSAVAELRRG